MRAAEPPDRVAAVLVGGYTPDLDGTAAGVSTVSLGTGQTRTVPVPSPSYLVRHPDRPLVFAVTESAPSRLTSLAVTATGELSRVGSAVVTSGEGGCHLAVTPDGRRLLVAHYGSGTVSSFRVAGDGTLSEELDAYRLTGSGPDAERQSSPHAHQVVAVDDELLVCDLGSDCVHRLRLDGSGRLAQAAPPVRLPPGSGPRHLVVVGEHLAVACELSAEVWLGRRTPTGWEQVHRVPSSGGAARPGAPDPADDVGPEDAGTVYPSAIVAEKYRVYVANRGPGTVSVLDLDPARDTLTLIAEFDCGGRWPRDLALSPGRLWVALQTDHRVTVFSTSTLPPLGPVGGFAVPSPTCLLLVPAPGALGAEPDGWAGDAATSGAAIP